MLINKLRTVTLSCNASTCNEYLSSLLLYAFVSTQITNKDAEPNIAAGTRKQNNHALYTGVADKSLARPGVKQAVTMA